MQVLRSTWLDRKPSLQAQGIVIFSYLFLAAWTAVYWHDLGGYGGRLIASGEAVFARGEWWRLWTTALIHADLGHFLANTVLFLIFGYFLAGHFGVVVFPGLAFLAAGLTNALALATYPPELQLLGASGMVTWMGGAWLALYVAIARRLTLRQRLERAVGVALLLFAPTETFERGVSHRTHLLGFALGLMMGALYFRVYRARFRAAEVFEEVLDEADRDEPPEPW